MQADGWFEGVDHTPSSNCDERPPGAEVSLLVIHGISLPEGVFGTPWIDRLFTNSIRGDEVAGFDGLAGLRVSAHLLIRRGGDLVQYVSLRQRAWHAGISHYRGRERCNDFSVGIELEGSDHTPYTESQYRQLQRVITVIIRQFPAITPDRIVGHCDIAPGRKSDPGPYFDWSRVRSEVEWVE